MKISKNRKQCRSLLLFFINYYFNA